MALQITHFLNCCSNLHETNALRWMMHLKQEKTESYRWFTTLIYTAAQCRPTATTPTQPAASLLIFCTTDSTHTNTSRVAASMQPLNFVQTKVNNNKIRPLHCFQAVSVTRATNMAYVYSAECLLKEPTTDFCRPLFMTRQKAHPL